MGRRFFLPIILIFLFVIAHPAVAANFEIRNIRVSAEADDAVKAKDQAIAKAQKQAFALLIGKDPAQLGSVSEAEVARLVSNFSVQRERMAARSYSAIFTIRFDPNRVQSFAYSRGFDIVEQALPGTVETSSTVTTETAETEIVQAKDQLNGNTIVILPVLNIGNRFMLWEEGNAWRDVWQKIDHSRSGLNIRVPIGDINDIADAPDSGFLSNKNGNIDNILTRYSAHTLYAPVLMNQGTGTLTLSLYEHDGKKLRFIRKSKIDARPGYTFDDAVPSAIHMIMMNENKADTDDEEITTDDTVVDQNSQTLSSIAQGQNGGQRIMVTVPYESLAQWVSIQRRLRQTRGVASVVPLRVSPTSAHVSMISTGNLDDLAQSLGDSGFQLKTMPNGETVLAGQ